MLELFSGMEMGVDTRKTNLEEIKRAMEKKIKGSGNNPVDCKSDAYYQPLDAVVTRILSRG